MKNDKHLEVIERATSNPIKSDKDYIYVFENGEQADDIDVKLIGLDKLVKKNGYVVEIARRDWL
jgi:hypothetical protein